MHDTEKIVHEEVHKSLEGEKTQSMLLIELVIIIVNMNSSEFSNRIDFNTGGSNKYINQPLKFDYVYSRSVTYLTMLLLLSYHYKLDPEVEQS